MAAPESYDIKGVSRTMTPEITPEEEDDLLAAEYALRLLVDNDLKNAQARSSTDRAFAQSVTDWEIRLASLTDELVPEKPSPNVKKALMRQLFPREVRPRLWENIWIWQTLTALSLALLIVTLTTDFPRETSQVGPVYSAEIVTESGDFRVVAVIDKATNEIFLTKTAGDAPQGRILQVWAHGPDAPAISVGLWPDGDTVRLALPPVIAAVEGVLTIGVSEEPAGGSTTGSPSGRVFGTIDIPGVSEAL